MGRIILIIIALLAAVEICYCQQQPWQHALPFAPVLAVGQVIWTAKINNMDNQQDYIYVFTLLNKNQSLKIYKVLYLNKSLSSNSSIIHNFKTTLNDPRIHLLKSKISFSFISDSGVKTRYLFSKSSLSSLSNASYDVIFDGIYSEKHDIFFLKSNQSSIIYSNFESDPIRAQNITKNQSFPIEYMFGLGQNRLIKLFQGANYLELRDMNNFDKIQAYDNYTRISLPNTHYQCACINPEQNLLYILDTTALIIVVDLIAQNIVQTIQRDLQNNNKCFFSKDPINQIIFVQYRIGGQVIFNSYQFIATYANFQINFNYFGQLQVGKGSRAFIQTTPTKVQLSYLLLIGCNGSGFYSEQQNVSVHFCKYCMLNCIECSDAISCTTCITGIFNPIEGACPNPYNSGNSSNSSNVAAQLGIRMPDGSIRPINLSHGQTVVIDHVSNGITYSNEALEKIILVLTTFPFIYFFLSNINFFAICSLYAFLNVKLPQKLYQMLKIVQQVLSTNILSFLGIKFNLQCLISQQKVENQQFVELGVSSNFIETNYQGILAFIFTLILAMVMKKTSQNFDKNGLIYRLLNQKYSEVIIGVILSNFSQILLPYYAVLASLNFLNFPSKVNLFIQNLVMGMFLIFMGFIVAFLVVPVKNQGKNKKNPDKNKQLSVPDKHNAKEAQSNAGYKILREQRQNIYFGFNNLIYVLLVMIENPVYFLVAGQMFSLIGIYKACSYQRWRTNRIVMSMYPILFHLCFVIFYVSSDTTILIYTFIVCLVVFLVGSFHQFAMMVAELIDFIVRYAKNKSQQNSKVANCQIQNGKKEEKLINTRRKENRQQNLRVLKGQNNKINLLKELNQKNKQQQKIKLANKCQQLLLMEAFPRQINKQNKKDDGIKQIKIKTPHYLKKQDHLQINKVNKKN